MKDILKLINEKLKTKDPYIYIVSSGKMQICTDPENPDDINGKQFDSFDEAIKEIWKNDPTVQITILGGENKESQKFLKK